MSQWQICTSLHAVRSSQSLLRNKKITSASSLMSLSRVQGSFDGVVAGSVFEAYLPDYRGSRSGRTLRESSSSAGRPRHESSIAKNYLKSSSIEKNCLRSSSTWTSGVHRDKESLPNTPKLHSLTRFQPGHQPENWRALQEEEATHGSVSLSSGTSGRCSCRNFGTCIITLMHHRVLYIVMICSGTSVLSSRRRLGTKPEF